MEERERRWRERETQWSTLPILGQFICAFGASVFIVKDSEKEMIKADELKGASHLYMKRLYNLCESAGFAKPGSGIGTS